MATGFHGKMKDELLSLSMSLFRKGFGIRGERENGKDDGNIPAKDFLRNLFSPPRSSITIAIFGRRAVFRVDGIEATKVS